MEQDNGTVLRRKNPRLINDKPIDPEGLEPIIGYTQETPTSLFDACRSLVDLVENILNYVAIAIEMTPKQPPDGLTSEESAAIRLYTMEWTDSSISLYTLLNSTLRSDDRTKLKPWFKYLKLFLTALVKLPCVPPQTVWRGIRRDVSGAFPRGSEVIWWSFSSCTTTLTVLENELYLGKAGTRTLFSIEVLNARNISAHSYFEAEDEILLLPATYMQVRSQLNPTADLHIIHLRQMVPLTVLLEPPFQNAQLYPANTARLSTRSCYRQKKYIIPLAIFLILTVLGITLGSVLGTKSTVSTSNKKALGAGLKSCLGMTWSSSAITVAGGNSEGSRLDQLWSPDGLFLDANNILYVVDCKNNRIMKWTNNSSSGSIVAGGNGAGNFTNQLNFPIDMVMDKNGTMYITEYRSQRVQKWSLNAAAGEIILSNRTFTGIGLDPSDALYTSDWTDDEVKNWGKNHTIEAVIAFGLNTPDRMCIDGNYSVYVADRMNHRIVKILAGTQDIVIVAGGSQGAGENQLDSPHSVTVDSLGNIYVADSNNNRIMRWSPGATSGTLVVGGRGIGSRSDQLHVPTDLQFDSQGNLYVADSDNNRIQKFLINKNSC